MAKGHVMIRTLMVAAALIALSAGVAAAQDVAKGERDFGLCRACHQIGEDAQNMLGPELNGLDGRKAGSVPDYAYSEANKKSGIVWTEATFKQYIKNPAAMIPGTKMTFAGISDEQKINELWAYVSQFDADGTIKKK
jgi:cytochrome c